MNKELKRHLYYSLINILEDLVMRKKYPAGAYEKAERLLIQLGDVESFRSGRHDPLETDVINLERSINRNLYLNEVSITWEANCQKKSRRESSSAAGKASAKSKRERRDAIINYMVSMKTDLPLMTMSAPHIVRIFKFRAKSSASSVIKNASDSYTKSGLNAMAREAKKLSQSL